MKKKLIFYFYVGKEWKTNKANLAHFLCLEKYNNIFNEAEIYLALDNDKDIKEVSEIRKKFFSIFPSIEKISFIVINNTLYRESYVVKKYIIDKLGQDEAVFFAHNKGYTNITSEAYSEWYVIEWIVGLYYYSLEHMNEVYDNLYSSSCLSYGPFLVQLYSNDENKLKDFGLYKWYYAGTFYWINSKKLKNFIDRHNITLPDMGDRFYAENILANIFPIQIPDTILFATCHYKSFCNKYDSTFLNIHNFISMIYPDELETFLIIANDVFAKVNEKSSE